LLLCLKGVVWRRCSLRGWQALALKLKPRQMLMLMGLLTRLQVLSRL
jgi:hypothetical protein